MSGMNIVEDLSFEPEFHSMISFTENDINTYLIGFLKQQIRTQRKIVDKHEIDAEVKKYLQDLKENYNSHHFTAKEETLFSPITVHGYLTALPTQPKEYWSQDSRGHHDDESILEFILS